MYSLVSFIWHIGFDQMHMDSDSSAYRLCKRHIDQDDSAYGLEKMHIASLVHIELIYRAYKI